jgi:lipoate-protein ligase A
MFTEPRPDLIAPNPGGPDDPLGESVLEEAQPWLRVFEPAAVRVVIGRGQDPEREVLVANARADGVPIHRRLSGGGAVVLAPGMVVVALRLANTRTGTAYWLELVNRALIPAVADACGAVAFSCGHGDLALAEAGGPARKIVGASLRQNARWVAYLGVMLVADRTALMDRYLASPSRRPDYRGDRGHAAFCTGLERHGANVAGVIAAVTARCREKLAPAISNDGGPCLTGPC